MNVYVKHKNSSIIIGIDEAGRGPLAGPISVGAFAVRSRALLKMFRGVKDSKQLSPKQREEWFKKIRSQSVSYAAKMSQVDYAVSFTSAAIIDKKGISWATRSALRRSLKKLEKRGFAPIGARILLDGSLYAPKRYAKQKTIIDGDAKESIIALASICAKVVRDRRMVRLACKFPGYGLEIHKGYGTKAHYRAINQLGLSPIHRQSFLKGIALRH